eukprot:CAMPEP_0206449926 /NCGR_PEP_ID=MMETSP0324_2-20121206/18401_1 /ASSEMBLY_ACC=CAM_ASM_000836 /TAXON_ID=2866 /ORGANISM="Crypthecodinium cohnii, Strain Seligo" /LENGTH=649 /DNA_ID=CAMNT_0053919439 /DNA_START=1 /DNA_END=1950 /DNA_ORIENTATION=-
MVRTWSLGAASLLFGSSYGFGPETMPGWDPYPHHHQLTRNPEIVRTFDDKVLGNLKDGTELANLEVPRAHVFSSHIEVGTPGQELTCLLDLGSADIWVPSKRCKDCNQEHLFSADRSDTFMPAVVKTATGIEAVPVRASFPDGDIFGFLVQDTIALSGGAVTWKNQSFIVVEDEAILQDRHWDGICGLGFRTLSDAGTPFYKNMPEGVRPIFSLIPNIMGGHLTTYMSVGGLPHNSFTANSLAWTPAEPLTPGSGLSFWVVSGGLRAGGLSLEKSRFMLDSSTAYITAPRKHYRNLMSSLLPTFEQSCGADPTAGNLVVCDCRTTLDAGTTADFKLTIVIGGKEFSLTTSQLFRRVSTTTGGELCLLMVQQSPAAEEIVIDPLALLAGMLGGQPVGGPPGMQPPPNGNGGSSPMAPFLIPANMQGLALPPPPPPPPQQQQSRRLQQQGEVLVEPAPWEDVWTLGGVFLENFVVMLDYEQHRLGLGISTNLPIVGDPKDLNPTNNVGQDQAPPPINQPLGWQQDPQQQQQQQVADWQKEQQDALEKHLNEMHQAEEDALRARDFGSRVPGVPSTTLPRSQQGQQQPSGGSTLGDSIRGFVILVALSTASFIGIFQLWRKTQTRKNIARPPLNECPNEEEDEEEAQFALAE